MDPENLSREVQEAIPATRRFVKDIVEYTNKKYKETGNSAVMATIIGGATLQNILVSALLSTSPKPSQLEGTEILTNIYNEAKAAALREWARLVP